MNPFFDSKHSALYEYVADFFNAVSSIGWKHELLFLGAILLALLVLFNTRWGYKFPLNKLLKVLALSAFVMGVLLYMIGFANRGNYGHVTFVLLAIISSAEMFLLKSSYSLISDVCKDSPGFMLIYLMTYLSAVFCSIMFVLRAIGIRLGSWIKMMFARLKVTFESEYDLYVFFYPSESVVRLAKSIYEQSKKSKKKIKFLFICIASKNNYDKKDIAQMLGLYSDKKEALDMILKEDMDSLIVFCDKNIAECNVVSRDYLKEVGIDKTKVLFKHATSVKLLVLTKDEKQNLQVSYKLADDRTLDFCNERGRKVDIYCMARKCNTNTTLEEMMLKANEDIHIIDSSYLAISSLKMNPKYLPISFVDCNNGVVTSDFHALVIGFNSTGQEALKFLYEYGAFLGLEGKRSPFHCIAIDRQMDLLKGKFYIDIPGLKSENGIQLEKIDAGSLAFWEMIEKQIHQLNYIVIAMGDDDSSISLAIDIYKFACRCRNNNLNRFKIFVRSYNVENIDKLTRLQNYFNGLNMAESGGEIVVFGKEEDIFSYKMIIMDEMMEKAKQAYNTYNQLTNGTISWEERRRKYTESTNLFALQALKRKELQDFSNAFHIDTKMILAGIKNPNNMTDADRKKIRLLRDTFEQMQREKNQWINVNREDETFILLENLAKNEHLRWNASHILLGYVSQKGGDGCNEITKRHNCLVDWEELLDYDLDYQYYDYKFIEMALKIKEEGLL